MYLSQCKSCSHHICILNNKVLCGYKIDRVEKTIRKEKDENSQTVLDCPKE
jgi:hypothetical protein